MRDVMEQILGRITAESDPIPNRRVRLRDGTVGYCMANLTDCFRAALATTLQIPPSEVPTGNLNERAAEYMLLGFDVDLAAVSQTFWNDMQAWLAGRGYALAMHQPATRADRWIGVCDSGGAFRDHCLVMHRDELLFDPAINFDLGELGGRLRRWSPDEITYGITITPTKE